MPQDHNKDLSQQLATDITPFSVWQHVYGVAFLLLTLTVLVILSLSWELTWQLSWSLSGQVSWIWSVVVSLVSVVVYLLAAMRMRNQPLHITLCDVNASRHEWQLLYSGYDRPVLWQAQMLSIQSLHHCVLLTFQTQYPSVRKKTVVIWKDQVAVDIWRRLKVLSL